MFDVCLCNTAGVWVVKTNNKVSRLAIFSNSMRRERKLWGTKEELLRYCYYILDWPSFPLEFQASGSLWKKFASDKHQILVDWFSSRVCTVNRWMGEFKAASYHMLPLSQWGLCVFAQCNVFCINHPSHCARLNGVQIVMNSSLYTYTPSRQCLYSCHSAQCPLWAGGLWNEEEACTCTVWAKEPTGNDNRKRKWSTVICNVTWSNTGYCSFPLSLS